MAVEREKMVQQATEAPPEQVVYGNLLLVASIGGIALMVVTFLLYISGLVAPHFPLEELPKYWGRGISAHEYVEATKAPVGWGWLRLVGKGDYMNFLGIALLAGVTVFGYLVLLPAYIKRKEGIYSVLVAVEILVLVLAAAGIISAGH
ncbi:MAG TPA: DUF1634 domain-containing protein [Desulfotomaculum sp.]|nr:DUF1634 domain-containing protein [Desulfotomaculum sp.]